MVKRINNFKVYLAFAFIFLAVVQVIDSQAPTNVVQLQQQFYDYNLEVLQGNVPGHSMWFVSGHNDLATTTRVTVSPEVTTQNVNQTEIHDRPATVDVASTSGDDAPGGDGLNNLLLIGLDENGTQQTENIALNGQNAVTSVKIWSAINSFRSVTTGSTGHNHGAIYVGNGVFTAGIPTQLYFSAEEEHNKGLTGYYTIPAGHTFVIRQLTMTVVGSNKEVAVHIETSSDGMMWITEASLGLVTGGVFASKIIGVPPLQPGTHFRTTVLAGGAGTEVTVIVAGELIQS